MSGGNYAGLFGFTDGAVIQDLGVVSGSVSGGTNVGGIVGRASGITLQNCYNNACKVTGTDSYIGGIVGSLTAGSSISNCHNIGTVTGSDSVGGIAGEVNYPSAATNCYNTGSVSGSSNVVSSAVVIDPDDPNCDPNCITNCYYLAESETDGIDGTTHKTSAQFASGEVAYLLQSAQTAGDDGTVPQVWGQEIGKDETPVLSSDSGLKVYKLTFRTEGAEDIVLYGNSGNLTLPTTNPTPPDGQEFKGWFVGNTQLIETSEISSDLVAAAQFGAATDPGTDPTPPGGDFGSGSTGGGSDPSYSPVTDVGDGGMVKISPRTPNEGDTVTITPDPDAGREVDEVTVTDRNGREIPVTDNRDGTYTFTQPAGRVTISVTFRPVGGLPFTDVPETFWAYDEIEWAYENGYVNGTSASTFSPGASISRQQVWMILARLSGADPANMAAAREWAMANDISDGTNPGNAVTRQQPAALLYRFALSNGYDNGERGDLTRFPDAGSVSSYAIEPFQWAAANGIIGGTSDGRLNPGGTATRAQFVVMLYRFWTNL